MRRSLGARLCPKDRVLGMFPRQSHRRGPFLRRCVQIYGCSFGIPDASILSIKIELFDHPAIFVLCNARGDDESFVRAGVVIRAALLTATTLWRIPTALRFGPLRPPLSGHANIPQDVVAKGG